MENNKTWWKMLLHYNYVIYNMYTQRWKWNLRCVWYDLCLGRQAEHTVKGKMHIGLFVKLDFDCIAITDKVIPTRDFLKFINEITQDMQ